MAMNYEQYRDSVFKTLTEKPSSPEEGRGLVEEFDNDLVEAGNESYREDFWTHIRRRMVLRRDEVLTDSNDPTGTFRQIAQGVIDRIDEILGRLRSQNGESN